MKAYKEYSNLYRLYSKNRNVFMVPFFVFLAIFVLAVPTMIIDNFPFGVTITMLMMIFPALLYAILWPVFLARTKKTFKAFTPMQLSQINTELLSRTGYDGLTVTSQAVVGTKLGLQLVPLANILWVYKNVTVTKLNGIIPIHKETQLIIADRNHKMHSFKIKNKGEALEFVTSELLKYKQDIVIGFERGMDDIYKKDINRLIAFSQECAEKRQSQAQED